MQNSLQTTNLPIANKLQFINSVTGSSTRIPTYRVLDGIGKPIEGSELPEVSLGQGLELELSISASCRLTKCMHIVFMQRCSYFLLWTTFCTTSKGRGRSHSM